MPNFFKTTFRTTVAPLLLMLTTPLAIIVLWMTCAKYGGSFYRFFTEVSVARLVADWPGPSVVAVEVIAAFAFLQAMLLAVVPGKKHQGPITPTGNRPTYKLNGVVCFFLTHAFLYAAAYPLHLFSPSLVYDNYGPILTTLTLFALVFCFFLYIKGSYWPSTSDHGRSGNFIWDYYWGVELHPQVAGFNLKQYTNCRLGMMGWSVILMAFAAKQYEANGALSNSMLVSVLIQQIYILKFFWWESGYFGSLDIMHDRAGYYIVWGVLCWIPGVYTLVGLYLVGHPIDLPIAYAIGCVALGLFSIWGNYDADAQRQRVRQTNGETTVWGRKPEVMLAHYTTSDGKEHTSLLLLSGWWGLARHIHYVTEIALSLAWTLPSLFDNVLPYFYVVYLTILLVDRSGRDELRCRSKYQDDWTIYCQRVRYRILPYVF